MRIRILAILVVMTEPVACTDDVAKPAPGPPASTAAAPVRVKRCPSGMALVGDTCIDRWEAHLVLADAPGKRHPGNRRPRSKQRYAARSAAGVKPQGYINRFEAASACSAAGKRLCSARQWLAACRGSKNARYPYGNDRIAGNCNTHRPHLPAQIFGHKTPMTYDAHYNNPKLHDEPGFLALTGQFERCTNDFGVMDMVGNLHEWVADDVTNGIVKKLPLEYGDHMIGPRGNGIFMGGYFSSKGEHGRGCVYITTSHAPDYHDYSIGFRCCREAAR